MSAAAAEPLGVPTIELSHVDAGYGPFRAIFDVSFALFPGRVRVLNLGLTLVAIVD